MSSPRNVCGSVTVHPSITREIGQSLAAQVAAVRAAMQTPEGCKSLRGRAGTGTAGVVRSLEP